MKHDEDLIAEISKLKLAVKREKKARLKIKELLVNKVLQLDEANQKLQGFNTKLESKIERNGRELAKSELRYRTLVETAQDIIFNTSDDGFFLYINATASELFGYDHDELVGRHFTEFIVPAYKKQVVEFYEKFVEDGQKGSYLEFPVLNKKGEEQWIGQNVQRVNINGQLSYSAYARNITERVHYMREIDRMKDALTKSETKYRSMIENMDLGILEVDTSGKILNAYDRFCTMCGYSREELIGKDAMNLLVVPAYYKLMHDQDERRKKGNAGNYEIKLKRKDGSEIWVLISGSLFHNELGEIIGTVGIHYDISDRKALETELQSARIKAEESQRAEKLFLANMSHEIRTPLNEIIGMIHLLSQTSLTDEQVELLSIVHNSTSLLQNLISAVLDISALDSNKKIIQEEEFDLEEVLERVQQIFDIKTREKHVDIQLKIVGGLRNLVKTDRSILEQVLMNLMANADKFTEEGTIELFVEIGDSAHGKIPARFTIKDTGIGMSNEQLETIFDKFKQVSMDTTKKFAGVGLGLTVAKKLLALVGSRISVTSLFGEGSTFSFEIVLTDTGKALSEFGSNSLENVESEFENITVLVAEDNKINQKYVSTILMKTKVKFDMVDNGFEAVQRATDKQYDLILMDIQMPIMDGFDATWEIRQIERYHKTPIIGLTAMTVENTKKAGDDGGIDAYITKPYTPDDLLIMLRKFLLVGFSSDINKDVLDNFLEFKFSESLDNVFLSEAYGSDIEYAIDIFSTFLETTNKELRMIAQSIIANDVDKVKRIIHRIKPTFQMVGLSTCSLQYSTLEDMIDDNWDSFVSQFYVIMKEYPEHTKWVKKELKRMKKFHGSE